MEWWGFEFDPRCQSPLLSSGAGVCRRAIRFRLGGPAAQVATPGRGQGSSTQGSRPRSSTSFITSRNEADPPPPSGMLAFHATAPEAKCNQAWSRSDWATARSLPPNGDRTVVGVGARGERDVLGEDS